MCILAPQLERSPGLFARFPRGCHRLRRFCFGPLWGRGDVGFIIALFLLFIPPSTGLACFKDAPVAWVRELCGGSPQPTEQVVEYGLTFNAYQALLEELANLGYQPVWVDAYNVGSDVFFNAIFDNRRDVLWWVYFGQSGEAFQQTLDTLGNEGYRLVHVDLYQDLGQLRYTSIFVQEPGSTWRVRFNIFDEQFEQQIDSFIDEGFRLRNLSFVVLDGVRYAVALYDQDDIGLWWVSWGMDSDEFQAQFEAQRAEGRWLHYLDAHTIDGIPRFNAIWDERPYGNSQTWYNMTAEQLQSQIDTAAAAGQFTRIITGYYDGNAVQFGGLWAEGPLN